MAVTVKIGTTDDAANVINKTTNLRSDISANLKQPSSVEAPTFILSASLVSTADNYLYCKEFGRYYYITDITEAPGQSAYVTCSVDALKSYADEILALQVNVSRTETEHSNIIDTNVVTTANDEIVYLPLSGGELTRAAVTDRRFVLLTSN